MSVTDGTVLRASDETTETGHLFDATRSECEHHILGVPAGLQLVLAIVNWRTFRQLLLILRIPLEDGLVNWMPDGLRLERAPVDF